MIRLVAVACLLTALLQVSTANAVPCWPCPTPEGIEVVIHEYPQGDFDGNGVVTLSDALMTLDHVGERYSRPMQADWNRNYAVTLADVLFVVYRVGPPPTALPAETETPTAVPTVTETPTP